MTIDHTVRQGRHAMRRSWSRAATVCLAGALALLAVVQMSPAPASAAEPDPDTPFRLPALFGLNWPSLFSGADDQAGYLRTGGVNCARPEPLPASNAGSGQGYQVPFVMALTDGRVLAGYSPLAREAGEFPFGASAYGITGWVRGWVGLPSLRIEVPRDGVTLCSGAGMVRTSYAPGQGRFTKVFAATDAPTSGTDSSGHAWTELVPIGTPRAAVTGLTPSGALEFSATMKVEMHAMQNKADDSGLVNDCTVTVEMSLGTTAESLPTTFPPVDGVLRSDPGQWTNQIFYDRFYSNPFDLKSSPPTRYQMPPRALDGALPGRSATVVNGTVAVPPVSAPSPPRSGVCEPITGNPKGGFSNVIQSSLAPISLDGFVQPTWQWYLGEWTSWGRFYTAAPDPLWEVPAGAVQTSVDITIDDIGMPRAFPSGYGFTS